MAVALNTNDSGTRHGTADNVTGSLSGFTVGAGSNIVLIAFLTANAHITGTSCTWNGVSCPSAGSIFNTTYAEIFYLVGPATGNKTLTFNWTITTWVVMGIATFTGGTTPNHFTSNTGTGTTMTVTVAGGDSTGATVATMSEQSSNTISTSSGTELYRDDTEFNDAGANYNIGTANSNVHSVTFGVSAGWSAVGVHIPAFSGGGASTPWAHRTNQASPGGVASRHRQPAPHLWLPEDAGKVRSYSIPEMQRVLKAA